MEGELIYEKARLSLEDLGMSAALSALDNGPTRRQGLHGQTATRTIQSAAFAYPKVVAGLAGRRGSTERSAASKIRWKWEAAWERRRLRRMNSPFKCSASEDRSNSATAA